MESTSTLCEPCKTSKTMGNIFSISCSLDGGRCRDWIFRRSNYLFKFQEDLEDLQSDWERLVELRNDVRRQVEMAEREQMQQLYEVRGWLSRVQALESQIDQLIAEGSQELEQTCLGGCCPTNCCTRYKLGNRVANMKEDVGDLMREKPQRVVGERLPPPGISERPSEATVGMDSKLDHALSSLLQEEVGIVGLYGLGGVGKTTLLTQINNSFSNGTHHDFDFVIWSTVSSNVNLERIQDDIWKKIGLFDDKWKSKGQHEKASSIWNVLSKRRFMLLLDDVWERLDLKEIGVPLQNKKNKIGFTTRSEEVCGKMEADQKIKVECLTRTESWELFRKKVGEHTLNSHPEIPKLARAVAQECCGLPLVLTTIGRAMVYKETPHEWEYAIQVLQSSASKFPGISDNVLPLLRYSYDCLPDDVVRSCFLYCSLFPEDYKMYKSDLVYFWICEGFLDKYDDMVQAQNLGYHIIGTLKRACLLEEMGDVDLVKLHDIIREMALWIASETGTAKGKYLVEAGRWLTKAPEIGRWTGLERISLMQNRIEELREAPDCPNLLTLFLGNNHLKLIIGSFFQSMQKLRVLSLTSNKDITELPPSISSLVSLEYLDLSYTGLRVLPHELKSLRILKCLKLLFMPPHFSIPKQLISSFSKLRVIDVFIIGTSDGTDDLIFAENNEAFVDELNCLDCLHDMGVTITTACAFMKLLSSVKLRCRISSLYLKNLNSSSSLNITSLNNAERLYELSFSECDSLEDVVIDNRPGNAERLSELSFSECDSSEDLAIDNRPGKGKEIIESSYVNSKVSFNRLNLVWIRKCHRLKDVTWLVFAPNLRTIKLESCDQVQEVVNRRKCEASAYNGENLAPFGKLQHIALLQLPQLKSVFWKALPFECLKRIRVSQCRCLKKLPLNASNAAGQGLMISGETKWWNNVEWEDDATRDAFLPCFVPDDED